MTVSKCDYTEEKNQDTYRHINEERHTRDHYFQNYRADTYDTDRDRWTNGEAKHTEGQHKSEPPRDCANGGFFEMMG